MARIGGAAAFGPDAVACQQRSLRRLELRVSYRRLLNSAAFQAMREVLGELVAAEAIDPQAIPLILQRAAAFASNVTTVPPSPRPVGVPMAEMADTYGAAASGDWRSKAEQDATHPTVQGFTVLASTALHTRRHFQNEWIVEQYFGPDLSPAEDGLWTQLRQLPGVLIADTVGCLYDEIAPGAVVQPIPALSPYMSPYMIMLCPRVAAALGWHPDPRHVFDYLNEHGEVTATTLYWRDGGEQSRASDAGAVRHGYVLMAKEEHAEMLKPYLTIPRVARAWRATRDAGGRDREVNCASRPETTP